MNALTKPEMSAARFAPPADVGFSGTLLPPRRSFFRRKSAASRALSLLALEVEPDLHGMDTREALHDPTFLAHALPGFAHVGHGEDALGLPSRILLNSTQSLHGRPHGRGVPGGLPLDEEPAIHPSPGCSRNRQGRNTLVFLPDI